MTIKKIRTEFQVGDLVYILNYSPAKLGIIVKTKNLLKLYDILIQTDNIYLKDVHIEWLKKATT
jgi:hypothetical protein